MKEFANPELSQQAEIAGSSTQKVFRVGEDSSLIILPPDEDPNQKIDEKQKSDHSLYMFFITSHHSTQQKNFLENLDISLGINTACLEKLVEKHIKVRLPELENQLFRLDAMDLSPSQDVTDTELYVYADQIPTEESEKPEFGSEAKDFQGQFLFTQNSNLINHTILVNDLSQEKQLKPKSSRRQNFENAEMSETYETPGNITLKAKIYQHEAKALKGYLESQVLSYLENRQCKMIAVRQISQTIYLEEIGINIEIIGG